MSKALLKTQEQALAEGRRLIVPLAGAPGLQLVDTTMKLAQQNAAEHEKVLRALAKRLDVDLLFPLMDLTLEANALGKLTVYPVDDVGAVRHSALKPGELERIAGVELLQDGRVMAYLEAVRRMSGLLPESVLCGAYMIGPFSLVGLLVGAEEAALLTLEEPERMEELCELATSKLALFAQALLEAGAEVICLLEPSAVMLGPRQFEGFSGKWCARLTDLVHSREAAAVLHICGNTTHLIKSMVATGADALSLDSPETGLDLAQAAEVAGSEVLIAGNLSPTGTILRGKPEAVTAETEALLAEMAPYPNFVLSTGCDLPAETPIANIEAMIAAGRA